MKTCANLEPHIAAIRSRTRVACLDMVFLDVPSTTRWHILGQDEKALISAFCRARSLRVHFDGLQIIFKDSLMQAHMPHLTTFSFLVGFNDIIPAFSAVPANVRPRSLCPNLRALNIQKLPLVHIHPESMPLLESFKLIDPLSGKQALALAETPVSRVVPGGQHASRHRQPHGQVQQPRDAGGSKILQVFTSAHMPALRDLSLQCRGPRNQRNFPLFLRPGPCTSLRKLSLSGPVVLSCLDSFPALPHLAFPALPHLASPTSCQCATSSARCSLSGPRRAPLTNCEFGENAAHAVMEFAEERSGRM